MSDTLRVLELPEPLHLSHQEVRHLIQAAQAGSTEARERMIEGNLRLVMSIAMRYRSRGVDLEDVFQVGVIGLTKAIDNFDLSYDVQFSTYAVPRILGEIRRHLRQDQPVRVSRTLRDLSIQTARVTETLTQELGRSPTPAEIGEELGVAREEIVAALDAARPMNSLDDIIHEDDGEPIRLIDQLGDEPESEALVNRQALVQVLAKLDPRERALITLRFFKEKTQTEVAAVMGMSQAHVSRLEKRILKRLRLFLDA